MRQVLDTAIMTERQQMPTAHTLPHRKVDVLRNKNATAKIWSTLPPNIFFHTPMHNSPKMATNPPREKTRATLLTVLDLPASGNTAWHMLTLIYIPSKK